MATILPNKRRHIEQLPAVHRTETLRRFFDATVDQVFQPGTSEPFSGYIGQRPSYYDPERDFYVPEPTTERQTYQLEAAMVQTDSTGAVERALPYDDLIGYLRAIGSDVSDHERLFETDAYSWAPPVDLDKLNSPRFYFWFGDEEGQTLLPTLALIAPVSAYIGNGSTTDFDLPLAFDDVDTSAELPRLLVNGIIVPATQSGDTLTATTAPANGTQVLAIRYGDLRLLLNGRTAFTETLWWQNIARRYRGDGLTVVFDLPPTPVGGTPYVEVNGTSVTIASSDPTTVVLDVAPPLGADVLVYRDESSASLIGETIGPRDFPTLTSGMRVALIDALHLSGAPSAPSYYLEGIGRSIRLVSEDDMIWGLPAQHVTIERGSLDNNPWSKHNHWVHRDSFAWSGESFPDRQALRPIIEFQRDLVLYRYGTRRLDSVDAVITNGQLIGLDLDILEFDTEEDPDVPGSPGGFDNNGPIPIAAANTWPYGSLFADNGSTNPQDWRQLVIGDRILVTESEEAAEPLRNRVYRVETDIVDGIEVIALTPETGVIESGSVVLDQQTGFEWYFDGTTWTRAQEWEPYLEPRFLLTDGESVPLDDPGRYPNSDFGDLDNRASLIFTFGRSTTAPTDSIVRYPLRRDSRGQIIFDVPITVERVRNGGTVIPGLYRYLFTNEDGTETARSVWNPLPAPTTQEQVDGVWRVPVNLQANPDNEDVEEISRGQWFEHFNGIIAANIGEDGGSPFAANLWRDSARNLGIGGDRILQHRAPLLRLMLTASDRLLDLPEAIRFVDREYARFRAKFVQKTVELRNKGITQDTDSAVDRAVAVLNTIKTEKGSDFPFAYSQMAGGGYFIPPTATAMGLAVSSIPVLESDDTYSPAITFIRGHDGSRTPAFGDHRDDVLLALETMIYEALPDTIRDTERRPAFDLMQYVGSRWSDSNYNRTALVAATSVPFQRWVQVNGFDYRTNNGYVDNDPFTWNYATSTDRYGDPLPGHWRGIYHLYYDTDRPHSAPWEMLGFLTKPDWWEVEYGPAPYTSGNLTLWNDLRDGVIRQGPRQGTHQRFARPGIFSVMPVDDEGRLLNPISANIVPRRPTYQQATRNWEVGDMGPVEALFMSTPAYAYACAFAGILLKPARAVELGWQPMAMEQLEDQWVALVLGKRPRLAELLVHGETDEGGNIVTVAGLQQWLVDHLRSQGKAASVLGEAVRSTGVRLAHKVAGFTARTDLRVVADDFGLLPDEDVGISLYRSPMTRVEVYSGVIVEWVGSGWRVVGYDSRDPFFSIIPGDPNGPRETIAIGNEPEPVIYDWRPNVYYRIDNYVRYRGSTYTANRSHTSGPTFEQSYWEAAPGLDATTPRVFNYLRGLGEIVRIPYGEILRTPQEVANLLIGFGRYLASRGWLFRDVAPQQGVVNDWTLAVREFLGWSIVDWAQGNFIALSPGAGRLEFRTENGTILDVENNTTGFFGLLNREGQPISRRSSRITRIDGDIALTATDADIFGARLGIAEVEHLLTFKNETIFGDTIYAPLFNLRQPRLRLIGRRSVDWSGRLEARGFILIDDSIRSSFAKGADDVRYAFGIEEPDQPDLRAYARHLTGFQSRSYLDSLLLSDTEQFEFHQGLIQSKGSADSLTRLLRSQRVNQNRDIRFLEEWAFKQGRFGVPPGPVATFLLPASEVGQDPQFIRLQPSIESRSGWMELTSSDARWIQKPATPETLFPLITDASAPLALPSAGPIRLSEVTYTITSDDDLDALFTRLQAEDTSLKDGDRIWNYSTAYESGMSWMVWKVATVDRALNIITRAEDTDVIGTRIETTDPHNLSTGDYVLIEGGENEENPPYAGLWQVQRTDTNWFEIDVDVGVGVEFPEESGDPPESAPYIHLLRPMRFPDAAARTTAAGLLPFATDDLTYLDNAGAGRWAAQRWNGSTWIEVRRQPTDRPDPLSIRRAHIFDTRAEIRNSKLSVQPDVVPYLTVVDPTAGIIAGVADQEIEYRTDFDPANYANDSWGMQQVGVLWWDVSTVRFLDPFTDAIDVTSARDTAEIDHRLNTWSKIAPGTRVSIMEWVESNVIPVDWAGDGAPPLGENQPYTERRAYDAALGREVTLYYYWVEGRTVTPITSKRSLSAATVARIVSSPSAQDVPWVAPVMRDAVLVGGLNIGLTEDTTALRLETQPVGEVVDGEWRAKGITHDEWLLVRPNDEASPIPEWFWPTLRDSLAGFDSRHQPRPDPELEDARKVGIGARQSMFDIGEDEAGLRAARRSFVEVVNDILSRTPVAIDRTTAIANLNQSDVLMEYYMWTQEDDSDQIELPPETGYSQTVYTLEDLRALDVPEGTRVLFNRLADPVLPQWSILEANNSAPDGFAVAKVYDYLVETIAARDALVSVTEGEVVAVTGDSTTLGFWSLWTKTSTSYELLRVQRYRTDDFIEQANWYADGYLASRPPVLTYATTTERDRNEGDNPTSTFVRVDNDGTGVWIWTAFVDGAWATVARQNGTIRLSALFYAEGRDKHMIGEPSLNTITTRDGSWELRPLVENLQSLLTAAEINESVFSILHFCHAQQDVVDWTFKTSFLTVAGYGEALEQTPISVADSTDDLISYIEEVKPYRVKVRDVLRRYASRIDTVNANTTDFDKPPYLDGDLNLVRVLDIDVPRDQSILSTNPWRAWIEALLESDPSNPVLLSIVGDTRQWVQEPDAAIPASSSLVRRLRVRMRFDRTAPGDENLETDEAGWPLPEGGDQDPMATAINRIDSFYAPTSGMRERDPVTLLNTGFKGVVIEGEAETSPEILISGPNNGDTIGLSLNPDLDYRQGLNARDPHSDSGKPPERVIVAADDSIVLRINSKATPGAAPHVQRHFVLDGNTATVDVGMIAQHAESVMAYVDGVRIDSNDLLDLLAGTVEYAPNAGERNLLVHAVGMGGRGAVAERFYVSHITDATSYRLEQENHTQLDLVMGSAESDASVTVNGVPTSRFTMDTELYTLATGEIRVAARIVTLEEPAAPGADLIFALREVGGASLWYSERLPPEAAMPYEIANSDFVTAPEHAATIVEMNGLRLTPPPTVYGRFGDMTSDSGIIRESVIDLGRTPQEATVIEAWIQEEECGPYVYYGQVDRWEADSLQDAMEAGSFDSDEFDSAEFDSAPRLIIYDRYLIGTSTEDSNRGVIITMYEGHDYTVDSGTLDIIAPIPVDAQIDVMTHSQSDLSIMQTWVFNGNSSGRYEVPKPVSLDYAWVTVNGRRLAGGVDFTYEDAEGFDSSRFDSNRFDEELPTLYIPSARSEDDVVVITLFLCGTDTVEECEAPRLIARPATSWQSNTRTPMRMRDGDEDWEWLRRHPIATAALDADLLPDDTTITVNLRPHEWMPLSLQRDNPLPVPNVVLDKPGVMWVGGERIEYWTMTRDGDIITLSDIRRATQGSTRTDERRAFMRFTADGNTTDFTVPYVGSVEVNVSVPRSDDPDDDVFVPTRHYHVVADYTLSTEDIDGTIYTTVSFLNDAVPVADAVVTITVSLPMLHPVGAQVFSGTENLKFPPGPNTERPLAPVNRGVTPIIGDPLPDDDCLNVDDDGQVIDLTLRTYDDGLARFAPDDDPCDMGLIPPYPLTDCLDVEDDELIADEYFEEFNDGDTPDSVTDICDMGDL